MGGKYTRGRQYFYLCFTLLILPLLLDCATIEGIKNRRNVYKHLQRSHKLIAKRDYKGAIQENQKVLSLFDEIPHRDKALFNMGLIYAHNGNPEKDYKKSLNYFEKLFKQYPQSPLAEQAKIWTGVLKDINNLRITIDKLSKAQKTDEYSISKEHLNRGQKFLALGNYEKALQENQKILYLSDEAPHKDEALFNIGLIYAHYGNPEKDYKRSRGYFKELVNRYPQSPIVEEAKIWLDLFNIIEREKQVDIEIEKRKKELTNNNVNNGFGKDISD